MSGHNTHSTILPPMLDINSQGFLSALSCQIWTPSALYDPPHAFLSVVSPDIYYFPCAHLDLQKLRNTRMVSPTYFEVRKSCIRYNFLFLLQLYAVQSIVVEAIRQLGHTLADHHHRQAPGHSIEQDVM